MELKPVALVTWAGLPGLSEDDQALVKALADAGLKSEARVWDDPAVDWGDHAGLLIRSTWDYHERLDEFSIWLDNLERRCVPVFNPLPTLRWNMTKRYLKECGGSGLPVVPTVWLEPAGAVDLEAVLLSQGWEEAVLKPVVSAGAYRTTRVRRGETAGLGGALAEAVGAHGAMLQPYLKEIESEGEVSFIFVDGMFCHAVLKKPAAGDFRVQEKFGGTTAALEVSDELARQALLALDVVKLPWLYARVDAVRAGDALLLAEIELLEPSLYFRQGPQTAARLAQAIRKRL